MFRETGDKLRRASGRPIRTAVDFEAYDRNSNGRMPPLRDLARSLAVAHDPTGTGHALPCQRSASVDIVLSRNSKVQVLTVLQPERGDADQIAKFVEKTSSR